MSVYGCVVIALGSLTGWAVILGGLWLALRFF
jgi:hypothetical protein